MTELRCFDCKELVPVPGETTFMPVILNADGTLHQPGTPGGIHTQLCLMCSHWRYWDQRMREGQR